jgi:tRNA U34 2-thiouridine synthase MnmA/TrmU
VIIDVTRKWFEDNSITDAVVGYSGGIDSTVTALLLKAAGVSVHGVFL